MNGMGVGRIPWYEAMRWADYEGLDEEETETLVDIIERLDLEELRLIAADEDKSKPKGRKK